MIDLPAIRTHRLSKWYGRTEAVRELNLSVARNRITGFLGRNGAGKSSTIKMLLGMMRPTSGEGSVLGKKIDDPAQSVEVRKDVAYVSEDKRLYSYMTVEQLIRFTASFYPDWQSDVATSLLRKYELPPDRRVKALSKGMHAKLALLLAFARRPKLLILDEPSAGLDPVGVEQLLEGLVSLCGQGTTVFFSSHQIPEVERIADQVCMIEHGHLVADVSLDEIRQSWRQVDVVFPFEPANLQVTLDGVESVQTRGRQMSLCASGHTDEIVAWARGFEASAIDVAPLGLREVFLKKIGAER
ncbi:MAG TPA: ABC transporter ATP-binding protein [Bryobacteraceae bacterium]|jgi:ABC-2 type transport system ATP-binding protein|nr:ABC transporter ATP-binding protein [Bryobacteraceae bacterium]